MNNIEKLIIKKEEKAKRENKRNLTIQIDCSVYNKIKTISQKSNRPLNYIANKILDNFIDYIEVEEGSKNE